MSDCASIDPLVTPFVDGELSGAALDTVERHLRHCPPCYSRVAAEREVRGLLKTRQGVFKSECAPLVLRARCAGHRVACPIGRSADGTGTGAAWRRRRVSLAAAAVLLVAAGGALFFVWGSRSDALLAAELTADHVKCFTLNGVLDTHESAEVVEHALAAGFDWDVKLPAGFEREGLDLVGSRPCLYDGGRVAHVMYRHHGQPVSLFMLPGVVRRERLIAALGHECAIWSDDVRTFVLVARESRADVERLARVARAEFH